MPYLGDVAIFGLLVLALLFSSYRESSWWKEFSSIAESALLRVSFYLGLAALIVFLCGLGSGSRLSFILFPLLYFTTKLLKAITQPRRAGVANWKALLSAAHSLPTLDRLLLLYLSAVFALTFLITLAPPNATEWDALMYHLAAPAQYLRHGKIVQLPYDHHTYFPFTIDMLFLWGLALKGPVLAKLFHWLMLPLCCGALIAIGKKHLSLRAGLFAAALFASLPVVQAEASTAYIDLGLTAFTLLAYLCFANWRETGEARWLIMCGAFCGFCIGTKYLGVLTLGWLGVWALFVMAKGRSWQAKPLFAFAGLALLLGGGWYLRNWVWTGNPVYPFAYEVFGGQGWSLDRAVQYKNDQLAYGFGRSWEDLLAVPWRLAMTPFNTGMGVTTSNGQSIPRFAGLPWWPIWNLPAREPQNGLFETAGMVMQLPVRSMLGPALLAFGVPVFFVRRKPWLVNFIILSVAFYGLFWFFTGQYLRYLIPAFALWCLPCGWVVEKFLRRGALLKNVTGGALVLWFLLTPVLTAWDSRRPLEVALGQVAPEEFLARTFPPYVAMRRATAETSANAKIAVYGEPRCFYLDRDYFWADAPHSTLLDYSKMSNGADWVQALKAQGATHIYISNPPVFGGVPQNLWDDALKRELLAVLFEQPLDRDSSVLLYTIK
jgi:hypothetical protein